LAAARGEGGLKKKGFVAGGEAARHKTPLSPPLPAAEGERERGRGRGWGEGRSGNFNACKKCQPISPEN